MASNISGMTPTRKNLTYKEKQEVLKLLDEGMSRHEVMKTFRIHLPTLQRIIRSRETINQFCSAAPNKTRMRPPHYAELESKVLVWLQDVQDNPDVKVTGKMIKEVASSISMDLGISFPASNGWLDNFRRRYGLKKFNEITPKVQQNLEALKLMRGISQWGTADANASSRRRKAAAKYEEVKGDEGEYFEDQNHHSEEQQLTTGPATDEEDTTDAEERGPGESGGSSQPLRVIDFDSIMEEEVFVEEEEEEAEEELEEVIELEGQEGTKRNMHLQPVEEPQQQQQREIVEYPSRGFLEYTREEALDAYQVLSSYFSVNTPPPGTLLSMNRIREALGPAPSRGTLLLQDNKSFVYEEDPLATTLVMGDAATRRQEFF